MKLARYRTTFGVSIEEEPAPTDPEGGLIVETKACGLCSGELMEWYMERKAPHVLGHEVSGVVIATSHESCPVGALVAPHHHANCEDCEECDAGNEVHCAQWKETKLEPGGMAELFRVPEGNLSDTWQMSGIRPIDAALLEPIGCVVKSISKSLIEGDSARIAVLGMGSMGVLHGLLLRHRHQVNADCIEPMPARRGWAESKGLIAKEKGEGPYDVIFVLPGTPRAVEDAVSIAAPGARIVLFSPLPPNTPFSLDLDKLYFNEISLIPSYSCGKTDTTEAMNLLSEEAVKAEDIVSDFISLDELPTAYRAMQRGDILKAMVVF